MQQRNGSPGCTKSSALLSLLFAPRSCINYKNRQVRNGRLLVRYFGLDRHAPPALLGNLDSRERHSTTLPSKLIPSEMKWGVLTI